MTELGSLIRLLHFAREIGDLLQLETRKLRYFIVPHAFSSTTTGLLLRLSNAYGTHP